MHWVFQAGLLQRDYAGNFWDEHDQATACSKHPSSHSCRMSAERACHSRSQKTALAPCQPVKQRITFKIATLVQKVRTTQQPAYLADLLNSYKPERALRSSNQGLLEIPRTRTVIATKVFSICAPAIWNNLPQNIRNSNSISGFRRSLIYLVCSC